MSFRRRNRSAYKGGFTLVELLVSAAILSVIMLMVAQMIGDTSKIWKNASAKVDAFRQARIGFELMTDELRQATTNTYWDYFNSAGQTVAEYNAGGGNQCFPPGGLRAAIRAAFHQRTGCDASLGGDSSRGLLRGDPRSLFLLARRLHANRLLFQPQLIAHGHRFFLSSSVRTRRTSSRMGRPPVY